MNTVSSAANLEGKMTIGHRANLDFQKYVARIVQSFGTIFFRILFGILLDIQIEGKENLKDLKGPLIIVSNHVVFYDSFIFHLFFTPFSPLLPLRFMGVGKFNNKVLNFLYSIGIIPFIYTLFGTFLIYPGEGLEKNLRNAKEILEKNGTVVIFPAGSMRPDNSLGEFKRGAAALAMMTSSPILPVALKRSKGNFRCKISLHIGRQFRLAPNSSYDKETQLIHSKVEEIHCKIIPS